jgi:uncharacterized protein (TIGR02453 family)
MLQKTTLQFLQSLSKNNNKEWFEKNRSKYESAKSDFLDLVQQLLKSIGTFDPPVGELDPKKTIFRINRDVRFSKDKSPYKTNMGAFMNPGGKKIMKAGYYFHVEPSGKSFIAGGMYMPEAQDLAKIRQEIDYHLGDFKKIVNDKKFLSVYKDLSRSEGLQLSRPPKGYEPANPAIEFLKLKCYIATHPVTDAGLLDKSLLKNITEKYKVLFPLNRFLNKAIE